MNEVINKKFINIEKELYDSNLQINKYYLKYTEITISSNIEI